MSGGPADRRCPPTEVMGSSRSKLSTPVRVRNPLKGGPDPSAVKIPTLRAQNTTSRREQCPSARGWTGDVLLHELAALDGRLHLHGPCPGHRGVPPLLSNAPHHPTKYYASESLFIARKERWRSSKSVRGSGRRGNVGWWLPAQTTPLQWPHFSSKTKDSRCPIWVEDYRQILEANAKSRATHTVLFYPFLGFTFFQCVRVRPPLPPTDNRSEKYWPAFRCTRSNIQQISDGSREPTQCRRGN